MKYSYNSSLDVSKFFDEPVKLIKLRGYSMHNLSKVYNDAKIPVEKGWPSLSMTKAHLWLEQQGWIGLPIPNGYIVVDVDDRDEGKLLLNTLEGEGLIFHAIRTVNGFQFVFKDNRVITKQQVRVMTDVGFCVDYRLPGKGYIVLPTTNTEGREWVRHVDGGDLSVLPSWLNSLKVIGKAGREFELPIDEGSRNDTLYRHGCRLQALGRSVEQIAATIQFMNDNLVIPSLEGQEVVQILGSVSKNQPSDFNRDFQTSLGRAGHVEIGRSLLEAHPCFAFNGRIYCFKDGIYIPDGKRILKKSAQDTLENRATTKNVNEVVNWIERETEIDQEEWLNKVNPDLGYLNVKNGLLNWRSGELMPHTPEMRWTMQIPVNYDPAAKCPQIERFLKCLVPQDTIPVLEELIGYCLLPALPYQKAFLLKGRGSNGKSTFLELLSTFVGQQNVSHVSIHDLEGNRFARAGLMNKLVNSYDDLKSARIKDTDVFKILTNGEPIEAEFKGKDRFVMRSMATLIFSANELPPSNDNSHGYRRRWIIIPFTMKLGKNEIIPNFIRTLTTPEEMSGLLNVVITALNRLEAQIGFSENESTAAALDEYSLDSNNVLLFIREECEVSQNAFVVKKELYWAYKVWCENSGYEAVNIHKFYQLLLEVPGITEGRDNDKRVFRGIVLDPTNKF